MIQGILFTLGALSQSCPLLRLVRTSLACTSVVCSGCAPVARVVSAAVMSVVSSLSTGYSLTSRTASAASAGASGARGARSELEYEARDSGNPGQETPLLMMFFFRKKRRISIYYLTDYKFKSRYKDRKNEQSWN